jgi:hypothetical protein
MDGPEQLLARLSSLRCSSCGRSYRDGHVRIRAERGSVAFIDLICRVCGGQATAIATIVSEGSSQATIEFGELDEAAAPALGITDVLEMHRFLDDFDGDFRHLFAEHGPDQGIPPA